MTIFAIITDCFAAAYEQALDIMKPAATAFALTASLAGLAASTPTNNSRPTATLDSGPVFGAATTLPGAHNPINKFLGVPYAAKPERFSRPKPPKPWKAVRNATAFSKSCVQFIGTGGPSGPGEDLLKDLFGLDVPESEDCLYINAFAPAKPGPPDGYPVVLFIPGGGFQSGNGLMDLSGFAGYEDIVAVSFNYRTNIFGFPNTPDIPLDQRNVGMYDQRLAIEWVQANAAALGGNPDKVTIWGESAGSISVDFHMHAYSDRYTKKAPFRGAIMSSGQSSFGLLASTHDPTENKTWSGIAEAVKCSSDDGQKQLDCMRKVPTKAIIDALSKAEGAFMPLTDNKTIPGKRARAWRDGNVARVPLMMSTIAQEGRALINRDVKMADFIDAYMSEPLFTKEKTQQIIQYYKDEVGLKDTFDIATTIYTDMLWQCAHAALSNVSSSIDVPTWRYVFNASVLEVLPKKYDWLGKFHGSDVVLLFMTPTYEPSPSNYNMVLSPELYAFANYYRGVIGSFVRNPAGGAHWPAVGSKFAPFDVAVLGDLGAARTSGGTPVNETVLDERCYLYKEVYEAAEKVLP